MGLEVEKALASRRRVPYTVNMPFHHCDLPKSLAGGLLGLLLLGLPAAWSQPPAIHVQPSEPTINDTLEIDVSHATSCPFGGGRTTVSGKAITIEVFEGCACSLAPPTPVTLTTTLPPLLSGHYTIDASLTPDPRAEGCFFPAQILASAEVDVQWVKTQLRVDPPFPDVHDDVVLTLRSQCPMGIDAPSIYRHQVLIRGFDSGVAAPCTQDLSWENEAHLGPLEPGRYTVVWNYDDGSGAPTPITSRTFVVRAAAK